VKPKKDYAKYGGLAFQLLAFIAVGYFIGSWIDKQWNTSEMPYGIAGCSTLFLLMGLYSVVRDIISEK
jgi:F0F1-type ATP synthase assembly protein I